MFVQQEFVIAQDAKQRIDALLIIRLDYTHARSVDGSISWFDGTPRRPDEIEVRLALELDRSTENLLVISDKARMYRDLTYDGVYTVGAACPGSDDCREALGKDGA